MPGTSGNIVCRAVLTLLLALVPSLAAAAVQDMAMPDLQDMQIIGRVLGFQQKQPSGTITLAVIYDGADTRSRDEADAIAALLGNGLAVSDLTLRPVLVEQARLGDIHGYGALITTGGIDQRLLAAGLKEQGIPCLTMHLEQVEHGACVVAIRSMPSVSIVVSKVNASLAGVRFATAFLMMVREI